MTHKLYRSMLQEEEKFLSQLQRTFQDQLNRLKVEELTLLKLISSSDPSKYQQQFEFAPKYLSKQTVGFRKYDDSVVDDDLPLSQLRLQLKGETENSNDLATCPDVNVSDLHVNSQPLLDLDVNKSPLPLGLTELRNADATSAASFTGNGTASFQSEELVEEDDEDDEDAMGCGDK